MPRKVRDLVNDLLRAGFTSRAGKGSHRIFNAPGCSKTVTISGAMNDDAHDYMERQVREALKDLRK